MRVAFLGMGIMGRWMAANLVKAGHEVAVWNRSAGKDLEGARSAASPADAAEGVEVVWMCVSDTKAVDDVLFGPGRSEEHTSELQSHLNLVCRLLLEKKNTLKVLCRECDECMGISLGALPSSKT